MNKLKFLKSTSVLLFILFSISTTFAAEKNITYMQILQKPNDLDLNLKYAKQQGDVGNFKQTISTLERLNMIFPDNVEIKLYLLSVLVQVDSPEKANTIIEEMKLRADLSPEDLETLKEIEEEILETVLMDNRIFSKEDLEQANTPSKDRLRRKMFTKQK